VLLVLAVLYVVQKVTGGATSVYNFLRFRRQMKWCKNCGEYHAVGGTNGTFWEEDGRYYFMKDGVKHDVTDFVNDRAFHYPPGDGEEDDEEDAESFAGGAQGNRKERRKGKKKAKQGKKKTR